MAWIAFSQECDICGQLWVGVAPVGAIEAQCPKCGHFNPIPGAWEAIEARDAQFTQPKEVC